MSYRKAIFVLSVFITLIPGVDFNSAKAHPDCSVLMNYRDYSTCEKYGANKNWLNSVQKIDPDTPLSVDLLSHPNRLYIFEGKSNNKTQVKYELPAFYSIPPNAALVGNYGGESTPVLMISKQNEGDPLKINGSGNYLLANIDVRSQSSGQMVIVFNSEGADYLEVSSVTFRSEGNYVPDGDTDTNAYKLFLAVSPSKVFIHDSTFIMPDVHETKTQVKLSAVTFLGEADEGSDQLIKVKYYGNRIISEDYNKSSGNLAFQAIVARGHVEIGDSSSCNSARTSKGVDLLSADSTLLRAADITSMKPGAIGFTNGYAWGWTPCNDSGVSISYDTWDYWSKQNINAQCYQKSDAGGDPYLPVKIIVPVVVVGILAIVGLIAVAKLNRATRNL